MTKSVLIALLGCTMVAYAEAPAPQTGQASEAQIADQFEKAAPDLFAAWVALRPSSLREQAKGVPAKAADPRCSPYYCCFFTFTECVDEVPPREYSIDVKKTDSLLRPVIGIIRAPIKESCVRRNVVPSKLQWDKKKSDTLAPLCVGKPYEECIAAGGKDASSVNSPSGRAALLSASPTRRSSN